MPTIGWTVLLEGKAHTVELDHGWLLGRRIVRLDGKVIEHTATLRHALLDRGSHHQFAIGHHTCGLSIESTWAGLFSYTITVDGRALPPSTPIPSQAFMMMNTTFLGIVLGLLATALLHGVRVYFAW